MRCIDSERACLSQSYVDYVTILALIEPLKRALLMAAKGALFDRFLTLSGVTALG